MVYTKKNKIIFAIHDAHPWGGQDKYTLEIAKWIAKKRVVELHAYRFVGEAKFSFKPIQPNLQRPVLFKSFYYHFISFFRFLKPSFRSAIINGMGACSLRSDVVQVLFVHKAWHARQKRQRIKNDSGFLKKTYHFILRYYDLFTEHLAFTPKKNYISISKSVQKELATYFPGTKPGHVVYPGIDPEQFRPLTDERGVRNGAFRKALDLGHDEIVFLFVGSYERKGLALVLQSLSLAVQKNWSLLVVGKGDIPRYQKMAAEFGIVEKVKFMGSQADVAPFYQAANFFIFPTQYEPFGMVVLEAMACGAVPIVSQCAGAAELVKNDENGLLLKDETSLSELSSIVQKILQNPKDFRALGLRAEETAQAYSWEQVAGRYLAILDEIESTHEKI